MARFTSYTRKNTPTDSDVILIADSADSSENKTVLFGGLWSWLTNKFSSATIGALNTTSKTVVGAINEVSQVDTNLNTAGKAADAGAVGDALALKANSDAVYTKAQVDNLLPTIDDELDDNSTNPIQNKVVAEEISGLRADLGNLTPGLSQDARAALLACIEHVCWTDGHGREYYNALQVALYPDAGLVSITANRTSVSVQSGFKTKTAGCAQSSLIQRSIATGSCQYNRFHPSALSYKKTYHRRTGDSAFTAGFRIGGHAGTCYPGRYGRSLDSIAGRSDTIAFSHVCSWLST